MATSVIPCLRSSIAAATPPQPAPTIRTATSLLVDGCALTPAADMRLLLLDVVSRCRQPYALTGSSARYPTPPGVADRPASRGRSSVASSHAPAFGISRGSM